MFQLFLQICIVLTGNFNFLNLLIVSLLLSLLDDKLFFAKSKFWEGKWPDILGQLANIILHAAILYGVVILFNVKIVDSTQIDAKIGKSPYVPQNLFIHFISITGFTKDEFDTIVKQGLPVAVYVGMASLAFTIVRSIIVSIRDTPGCVSKIVYLNGTIFYAAIAAVIFNSSRVRITLKFFCEIFICIISGPFVIFT